MHTDLKLALIDGDALSRNGPFIFQNIVQSLCLFIYFLCFYSFSSPPLQLLSEQPSSVRHHSRTPIFFLPVRHYFHSRIFSLSLLLLYDFDGGRHSFVCTHTYIYLYTKKNTITISIRSSKENRRRNSWYCTPLQRRRISSEQMNDDSH